MVPTPVNPLNPLSVVASNSLYQFMALAGLACFVLSLLFSLHEGIGLAEKVVNPASQISSSVPANTDSAEQPRKKIDPAAAKQIKEIEEMDRKIGEQMAPFAAILDDVQEDVKQDAWTLQIVKWSSLAMSLLGFFLWYWKIQRHQDAILRKQAEDARHPNPGPKNESSLTAL